MRLAQALLDKPKMFNHNHGLWGYTGTAGDGSLLTVQSTGLGGPSAAIVIVELAMQGARRMIRVGTCRALEPSLKLGDLVIATEAIAADGTSRELSDAERVPADPELLTALRTAAGEFGVAGVVASTDLFYEGQGEQRLHDAGAVAIEMETATLFALAARHGLRAAAILIVSDLLFPTRVRIEPGPLLDAERRSGELAAAGLGIG
jgi:uridine phosphorylase